MSNPDEMDPITIALAMSSADRYETMIERLVEETEEGLIRECTEVGDEEIATALRGEKLRSFLMPLIEVMYGLFLDEGSTGSDQLDLASTLSAWSNSILDTIVRIAERRGLGGDNFLHPLYLHGQEDIALDLEDRPEKFMSLIDLAASMNNHNKIRAAVLYLKKVLMKDGDSSELISLLKDVLLEGTVVAMRSIANGGDVPFELWNAMSQESKDAVLEEVNLGRDPEAEQLMIQAVIAADNVRLGIASELADSVGQAIIWPRSLEDGVEDGEPARRAVTIEDMVMEEGVALYGQAELINLALQLKQSEVFTAIFGLDSNGFFYDDEGKPY
ncbi:hypothetical protein HOG48_03510 [Candidatus Peregrinibacteria bacterium]|mgnify:CR=1 FL=1|jgi:hypothetical protein|nr:hypothetical protein [Candidatus Peregrinibacteria bacterium]